MAHSIEISQDSITIDGSSIRVQPGISYLANLLGNNYRTHDSGGEFCFWTWDELGIVAVSDSRTKQSANMVANVGIYVSTSNSQSKVDWKDRWTPTRSYSAPVGTLSVCGNLRVAGEAPDEYIRRMFSFIQHLGFYYIHSKNGLHKQKPDEIHHINRQGDYSSRTEPFIEVADTEPFRDPSERDICVTFYFATAGRKATSNITVELFDDSARINGEQFRLFPPIEALVAHFGSTSNSSTLDYSYIWNWPTLGLSATSSDPRYVEKLYVMLALSLYDSNLDWDVFRGSLLVGGVSRYPGQSLDNFCDTLRRNKTGLPLAPIPMHSVEVANYKTVTYPKKNSVCQIELMHSQSGSRESSLGSFFVFHFANPSLPGIPAKTHEQTASIQHGAPGERAGALVTRRNPLNVFIEHSVRIFTSWFWRNVFKLAFFIAIALILWACFFR